MYSSPNLIRVWRMRSPAMTEECQAGIIQGPEPSIPHLPAGVFLSVTEYTLVETRALELWANPIHGQVAVFQYVPGSEMRRGKTWDDPASAAVWLEGEQRRLQTEGWVELPLDPLVERE